MEKINHPAMEEHENHRLYLEYFPEGGGSVFTFDIKGGTEEAHRFIDSLELFSLLANVADVKSLVIHPATTTHRQLEERELAGAGNKAQYSEAFHRNGAYRGYYRRPEKRICRGGGKNIR